MTTTIIPRFILEKAFLHHHYLTMILLAKRIFGLVSPRLFFSVKLAVIRQQIERGDLFLHNCSVFAKKKGIQRTTSGHGHR